MSWDDEMTIGVVESIDGADGGFDGFRSPLRAIFTESLWLICAFFPPGRYCYVA